MKTKLESCKNCEKEFNDSYVFCPHCGQKAKDELTIRILFYNTISNYFSFDARFIKSFFPLLFKPGYLAKKFIEGKRLLYLHPAQMYLFISVVFFFLLSVTVVRNQVQNLDNTLKKTINKPIVSDSIKNKTAQVLDTINLDSILKPLGAKGINRVKSSDVKAIDSIVKTSISKESELTFGFNDRMVDSLITIDASDEEIYMAMGLKDDAGFIKRKFYAQVLKFYKQRNGGQILQAIYDTIPISLFVLLPIFAFIMKLLFIKQGLYAHHLVFSFYYFSFLFTVFSIILVVNYVSEIPDWIDFLIAFSTIVYLLLAIKRFYQPSWFFTFIKTGLATFIYLMIVIPIAMVIVGLVSFLFY